MLLNQFLLLGAFLFCTGIYGVLTRKHTVLVLMSIELMLAAVNINLVAFGAFHNTDARDRPGVRAVRAHDRRRRGRRRARDRPAHLPQPAQCRPRRRRRAEGLTADVLPRPRVARAVDPGGFVRRDPAVRQAIPAPGVRGRHRRGRRVVRARRAARSSSGSTACRTPTARTAWPRPSARSAAASAASAPRARWPQVEPVTHHLTWFQNGGVRLDRRHPDRRPRRDDDVRRHARSRCWCTCTRVEYMRGDRRFTHFYAALSLFTASMLLLVVADNTLQLLVGWELVGLCSFMLIGHWWEEKPNSDAAVKAFLTTRTGDIGLLVGVIMTYLAGRQRDRRTARSTSSPSTRPPRARNVSHTLVMWTRARVAARDHRQVRSVPAAHVAPRRHGRPDAGVGADPRRHDGRRRRLPRRASLPGVLARPLDRHARPRRAQRDGR